MGHGFLFGGRSSIGLLSLAKSRHVLLPRARGLPEGVVKLLSSFCELPKIVRQSAILGPDSSASCLAGGFSGSSDGSQGRRPNSPYPTPRLKIFGRLLQQTNSFAALKPVTFFDFITELERGGKLAAVGWIWVLLSLSGQAGAQTGQSVTSKSGSEMSNDVAVAMAVAPNGDVFVTGYSKIGGAGYDFETIKYDTGGNLIWSQRYDGAASGDDRPAAIGLDRDSTLR